MVYNRRENADILSAFFVDKNKVKKHDSFRNIHNLIEEGNVLMKNAMQDPVFTLDRREQTSLSLAYIQSLVVMALMYFGTQKGKDAFIPVPAMIAVMIVKGVSKWGSDVEPRFLPYNRLVGKQYSRDIFDHDYWLDAETSAAVLHNLMAIQNIPDAMRTVVRTLMSEHSVLHPYGLMGMRMDSWWRPRPCGNNQDNLHVRLTQQNCEEAECGLVRLGEENTQWCEAVGTCMVQYNDASLVHSRCGECHSTL